MDQFVTLLGWAAGAGAFGTLWCSTMTYPYTGLNGHANAAARKAYPGRMAVSDGILPVLQKYERGADSFFWLTLVTLLGVWLDLSLWPQFFLAVSSGAVTGLVSGLFKFYGINGGKLPSQAPRMKEERDTH